MACAACGRRLDEGASRCPACGAVAAAAANYELVLGDATRIPVVAELTLGRAPGSSVVLADPSVSRLHARISVNGDGAVLEDAGSSHGSWVDGERVTGRVALHDGATIRLGDSVLVLERRREATPERGGEGAPERGGEGTLVVPAGASLALPATADRPRLRSGYALKRLDDGWVLKHHASGTFLRCSERDAALLRLLDGEHSLADLIALAEIESGGAGAVRLARLLADLGERGFLAGVEGRDAGTVEAPAPWYKRLLRPRTLVVEGVGPLFETLYRRGGHLLFTRPALLALCALAVAGIAGFGYLVIGRYGTPFVVAAKIGLGGLVFLGGRFAVVAVHELAHGLAMASMGRRVERAGLKLVVVFPYAFVDTSEAWFEPRRRRIAVSAAGPLSDLVLGALFTAGCLIAEGTVRDVFFQLAFAAYVGAVFNLNPFLDRDGYHILVDALGEPGLRRRAREQFARRLSGAGQEGDSPVLARYSAFGLVWSVVAALFVIGLSFRYRDALDAVAPAWVVWVVLATVWVAVFVPVVVVLAKPLATRLRGGGG